MDRRWDRRRRAREALPDREEILEPESPPREPLWRRLLDGVRGALASALKTVRRFREGRRLRAAVRRREREILAPRAELGRVVGFFLGPTGGGVASRDHAAVAPALRACLEAETRLVEARTALERWREEGTPEDDDGVAGPEGLGASGADGEVDIFDPDLGR